MTNDPLEFEDAEHDALGALEPASWGVLNVLLAIVCAIALFVLVLLTVAIVALALGLTHDSKQMLEAELAATVAFDLGLLAMALAFAFNHGGMTLAKYGYRRLRRSDLPFAIFGIAGTYVILFLYIALISALHLPRLLPAPNLPRGILHARSLVVPAAIAACLVAPLVEESFFRGLVFRGLLGKTLRLGRPPRGLQLRLGFWGAALLSGVVFASVHGELGLLLPFTGVGALFAWIFWRRGSLWPGIIAHAGFNALNLTLALVTQH